MDADINVGESDGPAEVCLVITDGILAIDVSVLLTTADGSATGKPLVSLSHTSSLNSPGCSPQLQMIMSPTRTQRWSSHLDLPWEVVFAKKLTSKMTTS